MGLRAEGQQYVSFFFFQPRCRRSIGRRSEWEGGKETKNGSGAAERGKGGRRATKKGKEWIRERLGG
jgi:hypothetical protein